MNKKKRKFVRKLLLQPVFQATAVSHHAAKVSFHHPTQKQSRKSAVENPNAKTTLDAVTKDAFLSVGKSLTITLSKITLYLSIPHTGTLISTRRKRSELSKDHELLMPWFATLVRIKIVKGVVLKMLEAVAT